MRPRRVRLAVWAAAILGVVAATTTATAYAQTRPMDHGQNYISQLINYGSNKCLGTYGGSLAAGAQVVQFDCNVHPDQQWRTFWSPGVEYADIEIEATTHGTTPQCLALAGGDTYVGAHLEIYNCNGADDQRWKFTGHGSSWVIHNKKANDQGVDLVIAIEGGRKDNLAPVELYYWQGNPDQSWVIPAPNA